MLRFLALERRHMIKDRLKPRNIKGSTIEQLFGARQVALDTLFLDGLRDIGLLRI